MNPIPPCTPGLCYPVVYNNPPWASAGELLTQATCTLALGNDTIPAGQLTVDIVFDQEVNFVEVSKLLF